MRGFIILHGIRIAKDFTPETFGRLTTIGPKFMLPCKTNKGNKSRSSAHQVYQCECGQVKVIQSNSVRSGVKSCGCAAIKHGGRSIPGYFSWDCMIQRCTNKKNPMYKYYGGRGIAVCDRWLCPENGFANFLADMGPRPSRKYSIDRIDNDGNYCPENCRWATRKEQSRNRRDNVTLTYEGKRLCIAAWADSTGLPHSLIRARLRLGWDVDRVLSTPKLQNSSRNRKYDGE